MSTESTIEIAGPAPVVAKPLRLAMWSGPRNISTAMMRAWDNRPDTFVCDEPLYAHYLVKTQKPHPVADEVIASQPTDWRKVVDWLTGEVPEHKSIFCQKHMAHHLLPDIDRKWLGQLNHCFLIRHPAEVITSYLAKQVIPSLDDLGFVQQLELFEQVKAHYAAPPPVLDAKDVQQNPRRVLSRLCEELGIPFYDSMLTWAPGLRSTDGVWAKHWYSEVQTSTTFRPYRPKPTHVPQALQNIHDQCLECYEYLFRYRLQ